MKKSEILILLILGSMALISCEKSINSTPQTTSKVTPTVTAVESPVEAPAQKPSENAPDIIIQKPDE